jgi:DNA-binding response OmpR family regulator
MFLDRILVIDDDPLFRSLITSMLRREYLVTVACDGSEGYYKALEQAPQLVIIDVQMPGWDGLRTLQALRAHQSLARVPIMMLTSDASRSTVLASIESGANDYVIKTTMSRDELLKKVKHLVHLAPNRQAGAASAEESQPIDRQTEADLPHAANDEAAALQALLDNWE